MSKPDASLPRALVASESEALGAAVHAAGFAVEIVLQSDAAADRLAKEPILLVACDDTTDPRLVEHLRTLPGRRRRDLFVVTVAQGSRTGDRFNAWCRSTNLVVNPDDMKELKRLVLERRADEEQFYARFRALSLEVHQVLGSY